MKSTIAYGLIRVLLFAVVLTVLMLVGIEGWIAAILSAIISLCVSYIFLRGTRNKAMAAFAAREKNTADETAEDRD